MKLSVIIPVYQVEATLNRCVESVVGQTFTDLEVILVDDGSPDNCPKMCDEWAKRDRRIRVIHKDNGGLSDARNAGLDVASGEFIAFVDSDDYLQNDTYQRVLPLATTCDIVEFPVYRFFGSTKQSMLLFDNSIYTDKAEYWLKHKAYEHTYAWNKIFKASLFDGIRFPKGCVFEDAYIFPLLLQRANQVGNTNQGLYYYCNNDQGITAKAKGKELTDLLNAHLHAMQIWCDDIYYMHILNIQMDVFEYSAATPLIPYRRINILGHGLSSVQRLKAIVHNILGVKKICSINKTIHKWKRNH